MGVSFGGMLCSIIAQELKPKALVLISSAANSKEIPMHYKIAAKTHLIELFPGTGIKYSTKFLKYIFGSKSKLLERYIKEMDIDYCKKCALLICNWEGVKEVPEDLPFIHIKGSKDLVLPVMGESITKIKGAGHFAVYENADLVGQELSDFLSRLPQ